jgi:DNA-binding beta-propeller fold protein YncE
VAVVDSKSGRVSRIGGFPTAVVERKGKKRTVGPSSAAVGEGVVYVGNRGDSTVCAVDATALTKGACVRLESMPDGLAYVASTKELWVTTPRDKSITILDVSTARLPRLAPKGRVQLAGEPEGFAVDDQRGVFYTNLEDKDRTLTISLKTRQVVKDWAAGCGEDGPKGLSLDHGLNYLFVACTGSVRVRAVGEGGKELTSVPTGDGVDNIDYSEPRHLLFAGAARAAKLTVARVGPGGKATVEASVPTAPGARNPVVTEDGTAYLTDSAKGRLLKVPPVAGP